MKYIAFYHLTEVHLSYAYFNSGHLANSGTFIVMLINVH